MGGGDAPPSARRLALRSASREGGSLKPGGGKSTPDRQRRSFVAPGFVVARSAAPSTKTLKSRTLPLADACAPFGFGYAESTLRSRASSVHFTSA